MWRILQKLWSYWHCGPELWISAYLNALFMWFILQHNSLFFPRALVLRLLTHLQIVHEQNSSNWPGQRSMVTRLNLKYKTENISWTVMVWITPKWLQNVNEAWMSYWVHIKITYLTNYLWCILGSPCWPCTHPVKLSINVPHGVNDPQSTADKQISVIKWALLTCCVDHT